MTDAGLLEQLSSEPTTAVLETLQCTADAEATSTLATAEVVSMSRLRSVVAGQEIVTSETLPSPHPLASHITRARAWTLECLPRSVNSKFHNDQVRPENVLEGFADPPTTRSGVSVPTLKQDWLCMHWPILSLLFNAMTQIKSRL